MTCRTQMIAVALASIATWGCLLWRRSAAFAAKAKQHEVILETETLNRPRTWESSHGLPLRRRLTAFEEAERANYGRIIRYEEETIRKYRRLASFPWLSDTPDPVAPPGVQAVD